MITDICSLSQAYNTLHLAKDLLLQMYADRLIDLPSFEAIDVLRGAYLVVDDMLIQQSALAHYD